MTPTKEEIEAVLAGCDGVTPGPWFTDTEKNDGSYGFGEDTHEGFDSPVLFSETVDYYGKPVRICDAINSSAIEIGEEFDEDGHSAWDEQGRKNFEHIARLSPEFVRELAALALEALSSREAVWQPIETFPRDHFPGLVYGPYGQLVAFLDVTWAWWPCPATEALSYIPTHWMPLPTPPDQGSKSP